MAYRLRYSVNIDWIGDGTNAMVINSPTLNFQNGAGVSSQVPGGDAPSSGNLQTACTNMATDIGNQMIVASVLARIQAFATGGS